jgi:hypothetical protein
MNFLGDNRGQIRTIEAIFASILMLSSIALIPSPRNVVNQNDQTLSSTARNVLITLDKDGSLSRLIDNGNWATLRNRVASLLPSIIWFNLTVFDENMQRLNENPISAGTPISGRIVGTDYVCVSSSQNYRIYIVRFQLSAVN